MVYLRQTETIQDSVSLWDEAVLNLSREAEVSCICHVTLGQSLEDARVLPQEPELRLERDKRLVLEIVVGEAT